MQIVIDPGHGKWSRKRYADGTCETDVVFEAAIHLAMLLTEQGHETLLTKSTRDSCPSPRKRGLYSAAYRPDVFVSLHCNASFNPVVRGVCGLFYGTDIKEQTADDDKIHAPNGRALSRAIAQELSGLTGIPIRGPMGAKLWYKCPRNLTVLAAGKNWAKSKAACLIEAGFLTNDLDRRIMGGEDGPYTYALACARGIHRYAGLDIPDDWDATSKTEIIESALRELPFLGSYRREDDRFGHIYTVRFK